MSRFRGVTRYTARLRPVVYELREENQLLCADNKSLRAEVERLLYARESVEMVNQILERENERLRELVKEATDEIEAWGQYASDYFQQKHDLEGTLRRFRAALEGKEDEQADI